MNYLIVAFVILLAILLLLLLMIKNQRDKKEFLEEMNRSELMAEKHEKAEN
jgi:large-conductance mechanosensitive channel